MRAGDSPWSGAEGGDVNQARHFRIVAGFGDDSAAIGMPRQKHRAILRVDEPLGGSHILGERRQRVLHTHHVQSLRLTKREHLGPERPAFSSQLLYCGLSHQKE
jgi:hypothetical protein